VVAVLPALNVEGASMKSTRLTKLSRMGCSLFASSILSIFFASSSAHAQESSAVDASSPMSQDLVLSDPTISDDPLIEEVFITGSLLPKGNYESNAPITTINAEQFEVSNAINIEQLLNTLPQILTGDDRTSTFGFGWATADLRGLGTNRTLTLLDGNRLVPTFADGGTVDLNLVPSGIIERVEILTGGASTTYGSDAMAGVVNIITKEGFTGFEITTAAEMTEQYEDANLSNLGITFGTEFGNGNGHWMIHADVTDRSEVRFTDRAFSEAWNETLFDENGVAIGLAPYRHPVSSNGALFGPVSGALANFTADGTLVPYDREEYGFITTEHFDLQVPQNRKVIFSKLRWDAENFSAFAQLHAADVSSTRPMPPVPFAEITPLTLQGNPFLSQAAQQTLLSTPDVFFFGPVAGIDLDGDGITNVMPLVVAKWLEGLGETRWEVENEMLQLNLGFDWSINDSWGLQGNFNRGDIVYDSLITPAVDTVRLMQAVVPNPFDPTGQTCLDPSNGCVPYNIFGFDQASDAAKDFVTTDIFRKNESELTVANMVLSGNTGEFFNMPAGALGVAFGIEYLERVSSYDTDPRVAAGDISLYSWDDAAPLDEVTIDRSSIFFEMAIPVVDGIPGISFLELELAGRYTEHSTIGSTTAYKAAMSWFPIDDIQVRAGLSKSTRAPSIEEMFGDFGQEELNLISDADPCSETPILYNQFGIGGGNYLVGTPEDCIATGVPESALYSPEINIQNSGGIPVYLGGSPDLDEETAETLTLGVVWTPYDLEGFSASIDFFSIEVSDYIDSLPGGANTLYFCYNRELDAPEFQNIRPAYCAGLNRDDSGALVSINAGLRNLALHRVEGADFSISQRLEVGGGIVDLNYVASYMDDKLYAVDGTSAEINCVGRYNMPIGGNACSRPVTKLKHRATASWMKGNLTAQLTWRHLSKVSNARTDRSYYVDSIDAFNYFALSGNYAFDNGLIATVGVRNLFDKAPPILDGSSAWEANTFPNMYDVFGRSIFARLNYKFGSI
jgi:iron complex outermembrane receptor protein